MIFRGLNHLRPFSFAFAFLYSTSQNTKRSPITNNIERICTQVGTIVSACVRFSVILSANETHPEQVRPTLGKRDLTLAGSPIPTGACQKH